MSRYPKYKIYAWIIAVLILLNFLTLGVIWFNRQPGKGKQPPPPSEVALFFKNELGWNDEQSKKFENYREKYFKESKILMDSLIGFRKELFGEISKTQSNNQFADSLSKEIGKLQTKIDLQRYEHFKEIDDICTTQEQHDKFKKILMEVFLPAPTPESRDRGPKEKRDSN